MHSMERRLGRDAVRRGTSKVSDPKAEAEQAALKRAVLIICIAALTLILAQPAAQQLKKPIMVLRMRTVPAKYGVLETGVTTEGVMIRDETVVMTPITGKMNRFATEGERVRKGMTLLTIQNTELKSDVDVKVKSIEDKLRNFELEESSKAEQAAKEINDVKTNIERYKHAMGSSNVKEAHVARQNFINSVTRLKVLIQAAEHAEVVAEKRRSELKEHRESMWAARDQSEFRYKAAISGLVSYKTDGLEGALSLKGKKEDLARVIEDICNGDPDYDQYTMSRGFDESVRAGETVARVIDNFKTYIAVGMPKKQNELVEGKRVRVRFNSLPNETFVATHYQTLPMGKESQVLSLFQLDEYNEAFTYLRRDKTQVITSQSEGIIVPNSSIIEKDGYKGVYLAKRGFPIFQRVDIIGEGHGECVVSGIPKDVRVVRNPDVINQV